MFIEMKEAVLKLLEFSWPMLVISIIVAVTLRISYLYLNNKNFVFYKEMFNLFFLIYILCLFHAVTFQDVSFGGINYIPFKEILRYDIGSGLFYKNILGNVLLFLPYGFFIGCYLKPDKMIFPFLLSLILSLSIETTQLVIGRVFDIDDIILNVLGGLLGFLLYRLLDKVKEKIPKVLKKDIVLNIISCLLVGGLIWFLIP